MNKKYLAELGLKTLREQTKFDPRLGKPAPPSYTGYSPSSDVMTGEKLVGTGAIGPGGKQLTHQQIKYPNAAKHSFSGIPIPKLRDFFGRRRTR